MNSAVTTSILLLLCGSAADAQIAKGATKFLGNITHQSQVRGDFATYWNQITAENECKWGVVERNRNTMNWGGCDDAYNAAKQGGFPFRFHALIWGSQYPTWLGNLPTEDQKKEIEEWFDLVKSKYPDIQMIDVVNEAVEGHAPFPYTAPLGGAGTSGHDWVINSFRMARERWPDAILVLNDFNNLRWDVDKFIALANKVRTADPRIIDAIGLQAHDLSKCTGQWTCPTMSATDLTTTLKKLNDQVKLPIYITELDLSYEDDTEQLDAYKSLFPILWESPYVAGVTLWGYIYGQTWNQAPFSGLIKNDQDRPAFSWLKSYVVGKLNVPNPLPLTPVSVSSRADRSPGSTTPRLELSRDRNRLEVVFDRDGAPVRTGLNGRR